MPAPVGSWNRTANYCSAEDRVHVRVTIVPAGLHVAGSARARIRSPAGRTPCTRAIARSRTPSTPARSGAGRRLHPRFRYEARNRSHCAAVKSCWLTQDARSKTTSPRPAYSQSTSHVRCCWSTTIFKGFKSLWQSTSGAWLSCKLCSAAKAVACSAGSIPPLACSSNRACTAKSTVRRSRGAGIACRLAIIRARPIEWRGVTCAWLAGCLDDPLCDQDARRRIATQHARSQPGVGRKRQDPAFVRVVRAQLLGARARQPHEPLRVVPGGRASRNYSSHPGPERRRRSRSRSCARPVRAAGALHARPRLAAPTHCQALAGTAGHAASLRQRR